MTKETNDKEMNSQEAELFFRYGVNDKNISSIIAFLDEQWEESDD